MSNASSIISEIQKEFLPGFLPRALYIAAIICAAILVWPDPVTVFLAASFSCLTLPLYRKMRAPAVQWRRKLLKRRPLTRRDKVLASAVNFTPILLYALFAIASLAVPVTILVLLVAPQAADGLAKLQQLKASNFEIPPHWLEYINRFRDHIESHPYLAKTLNDAINHFESFIGDAVGMLVSQGVSFAGSALNIAWLTLLFLMLTVPFTQHSKRIRRIFSRTLRMPHLMLGRFITAVHKALKAIMLGIALVAVIQGVLCGIGFYYAGVSQPAFWGLLATFVAPIPAIGTAFVWFPICITLWFTGHTVQAIGLALWGGLLVSNLDSALRPFFLKKGIKAPFFVLILSILCGLNSLGPVGLIAGPVLLAIALQALQEGNQYYGDKNRTSSAASDPASVISATK